jgi:hypothetical protein
MTTPFLITGLPRSRTAWLSVVANVPGQSYCEHEPSLRMRCLDDLVNWYRSRSENFAGVSDSFFASALPDIMKFIPMRALIVIRPPDEVVSSLTNLGLNPGCLPQMMHGIGSVLGSPNVRTITFSELKNSYKVTKALNWLMPTAKVSKDWVQGHQQKVILADHSANREIWYKNKMAHEDHSGPNQNP